MSNGRLRSATSFSADWLSLLEECDALSADATPTTPLANKRFKITESQEHHTIVEFVTLGQTQPLQHEQFETLVDRIDSFGGVFDLQRLPPDTEPYAAMLSLHPRYECGGRSGTITRTDGSTRSRLTKHNPISSTSAQEHTEPDLGIYADMLLLVDAPEHYDPTALSESETPALINPYTLFSGVQRNTGDLRQAAREVLLNWFHYDQPVHGRYGSVQRTSRRNRTLRADEEVIALPEDTGIPHERILAVDRKKVDDAFEVTDFSETDVCEIEESEYVRKTDVDEEHKEMQLQGLKGQFALNENPDAGELRQEVKELEQRIEELTEFRPGTRIGSHP